MKKPPTPKPPPPPTEPAIDRTNIIAATRDNTLAWWEWHGRIRTKDGALTQPKANALQVQAATVIERMMSDGLPVRIICLKPRAKGSTTYFSAEGYARARRKMSASLVIGGQSEQADLAWQMWKTYLANDTFPGWGNAGSINALRGQWNNGSTLARETAGDVHAAIGGTYQFLHITELGRWPNDGQAAAGDVLANVLKCVPLLPSTMVVMESTAEGDSGEFPARWHQAIPAADYLAGRQVPKPGEYVAIFAPWFVFADSAMTLTLEEAAYLEATLDQDEMFGPGEERRLIANYGRKVGEGATGPGKLGDAEGVKVTCWEQLAWRRHSILNDCKRDWRIFDRDNPHSPAAAFTASGRAVFLASQLDACEKASLILAGKRAAGCLDFVTYRGASQLRPRLVWRATPDYEAWAVLWERPLPGRRYLLIVDPATGSERAAGEDPDRHAALVLRAGAFREMLGWEPSAIVARVKAPCDSPIDVLASMVDRLSWHYGRCLVAFEVNNSGLALYEALKVQPHGPPPMYERDVNEFRPTGPSRPKRVGWDTTEPSRRLLVETLQREVRELGNPGAGVLVPCPATLEELRRFTVNKKGKAEAAHGAHDDNVLALGIGLCLLPSATTMGIEVAKRELAPWERQRAWDQQAAAMGSGGVDEGRLGAAMRS